MPHLIVKPDGCKLMLLCRLEVVKVMPAAWLESVETLDSQAQHCFLKYILFFIAGTYYYLVVFHNI